MIAVVIVVAGVAALVFLVSLYFAYNSGEEDAFFPGAQYANGWHRPWAFFYDRGYRAAQNRRNKHRERIARNAERYRS